MAADFEKMIGKYRKASCDPDVYGPWSEIMESALDRFKRISEARSAALAAPDHKVRIGFTEDLAFNAFAGTNEDGDIIAICLNVPISLALLFNRALMFRAVMPWLDEFDDSHVDPKPLATDDLRFPLLRPQPHPTGKFGKLRTSLSFLMMNIALDFIFLHELGHLWNGHTSLVQARFGLGVLTEIEDDKKLPLSAIDRQTLEMDADCFAARIMATFSFPEKDWLPPNPEWEKEFGEGSTYLIIRIVAIYLAMRCFDEVPSLENMENRSHPPVALRQTFFMLTCFAALNKDTGRDLAELSRMVLPVIGLGEEAFALLTGKPVDAAGVKLSYSAEGIAYTKGLLKNWGKLRPQLEPLKRGGILAPVTEF
ncbi:hypothetical protein [Rhizobium ruizarguesonis]|uniref:hypothetical protein n=1 Tax=Rhizobium ruizarguesonis TaxID=2081791 RepID=UPI00103010CF|nr:hypothetical protein [Rhizobium ruizarguesonis]TBE20546.1 hypothetical protein ELH05_28260 [Rhizobium ruizarguesonis]TCA27798.1 hypothetical protein E0H66_31870 [Rhizobium leguminosarum bv. viciae]WSH23700.1 hypothetical protein U8Q07_25655 [Rhizobium ruizarguesonis]WSH37096.1 hypothetical protein U8P70_28500 [Rhizobium ruizarguesonis]